jgi:hypothetical protein
MNFSNNPSEDEEIQNKKKEIIKRCDSKLSLTSDEERQKVIKAYSSIASKANSLKNTTQARELLNLIARCI